MITEEIQTFVSSERAEGTPDEVIASSLRASGWGEEDIAQLLVTNAEVTSPSGGSKKIVVVVSVALLFLLVAAAFYFFVFSSGMKGGEDTSMTQSETDDPYFVDEYTFVPKEENGYFFLMGKDVSTSIEDSKYLRQYFYKFVATNTPPIDEVRDILSRYEPQLKLLEELAEYEYMSCFYNDLNVCDGNPNMSSLVTLGIANVYVLQHEGNLKEAERWSKAIISVSDALIASGPPDDPYSLVLSLSYKERIYLLLAGIDKEILAEKEGLDDLRKKLKNSYRNYVLTLYTRDIEMVDYITDPNKIPRMVSEEKIKAGEDGELFEMYHQNRIIGVTWKPEEVKGWLRETVEASLRNVDLECGLEPEEVRKDVGYEKPNAENLENFLGRTFYSAHALSGRFTMNNRICVIEGIYEDFVDNGARR